MIKPLFKHHSTNHTFIGQVAHKGDLWDIYTSECADYGEMMHARNSNEKYCQTMPVKMIEGGGLKDSALEAGKQLLLATRNYTKCGRKLGSLNELI